MKNSWIVTKRSFAQIGCVVLLMLSTAGGSFAADLAAPAISIAGIHSPSFSMEGAQLICSVRVENPNDVALPLTGAIVKLKLADTHAADGRLLKKVTIPSGGTRNVDLVVDLTMSAAAAWLPMFMDSEAFTLPFEVNGFVDVAHKDLGRVPFHETGDVLMTDEGLVVQPAGQ
jgi:LEA14-like dessication related protein